MRTRSTCRNEGAGRAEAALRRRLGDCAHPRGSPSAEAWDEIRARDCRRSSRRRNAAENAQERLETGRIRMNGMRYAVVIEPGEKGYGAYVPDLPGCVAVAPTASEVESRI